MSVTAYAENAVFTYDLEELSPVQALAKETDSEKLRFLANAAGLFSVSAEYSFTLHPENLYADRNLEPKVLFRDLQEEDNPRDFTEEYKALIGSLLWPKYSFEDYLQGGSGLYKKKKRLRPLLTAQTAEQVEAVLKELFNRARDTENFCINAIGSSPCVVRVVPPFARKYKVGRQFFRLTRKASKTYSYQRPPYQTLGKAPASRSF